MVSAKKTWLDLFPQYPVLKSLAPCLTTKELYNLGRTCRTLHAAILEDRTEKGLFNDTRCDGVGLIIRNIFHKLPNDGDYDTVIGCEANDPSAEKRQCERCWAMCCNECRVHAVFQNIYNVKKGWYAGYAFLNAKPRHIDPPETAVVSDLWELEDTENKSHNDLDYGSGHVGSIDAPLPEVANASPAVPIDTILNLNLGCQSMFRWRHEKILKPVTLVAEARKRFWCSDCYAAMKDHELCKCTLASRFVDRWICLRCHLDDWITDNDYAHERGITKPGELLPRIKQIRRRGGIRAPEWERYGREETRAKPGSCSCGKELDDEETGDRDTFGVTCNWCNGIVLDFYDLYNDKGDVDVAF